MSAWKLAPIGDPVPLRDCPPGLFLFRAFGHECLGLKSEYCHEDTGSPDAYVVESGEYFWGGTAVREVRDALLVQPLLATPDYPWLTPLT